jgi:hypothetical protein
MDETAFQNGVNDAQADIAAKRCRLFWQTRGSWGDMFTARMQERFNVQVIHISDTTSERDSSYRDGYNCTIKSHLDATFGSGSFDRAWDEIQQYRQETYQRSIASKPSD